MALNGVIARFRTIGDNPDGSYNVTRTPEGAYVKGRYTLDLAPLELADITTTAIDDTLDTLTKAGHGLQTGDGPFRLETADTFPVPLESDVDYYAIRVSSSVFKLATSRADAVALTAIDLVGVGVGAITMSGLEEATFRIASAPQILAMIASIQPVTGRRNEAPPESDRTTETRVVYTELELWPRTPGREADVVTIRGESWTVDSTEEWEHWGDKHFRSFISRDEVT